MSSPHLRSPSAADSPSKLLAPCRPSSQVHAAGQLLTRDFVSMLPFTDELVLLELSGADLLRALETGVGSWPALEGRFLQVVPGLGMDVWALWAGLKGACHVFGTDFWGS